MHAVRRAPRLRRLAALSRETTRTGLVDREKQEARYRLAEFLTGSEDGVYYNDAPWVVCSSMPCRCPRTIV